MPAADPIYIAVAGTIATGKTGLVGRLADSFEAEALREEVTANPYFDRFYADPSRWAFHSQVAFAADSLLRLARVSRDKPLIQDRTIYESVDVFGALLNDLGHLNAEDLDVLVALRRAASSLSRQPNLLIYLHAPVSVVLERVAARGREAERHLTGPYLDRLGLHYQRFIEKWRGCPVLSIDTSVRDLRDSAEHERLIEELRAMKEP